MIIPNNNHRLTTGGIIDIYFNKRNIYKIKGFARTLMIVILCWSIFISISYSNICAQINTKTKYMGFGFSDKLFYEADIRDVRVALKLWMEELNQQMGFNYEPNALIFDDVETVIQAISNKTIGMIALHAVDYFALKDKVSLEPFFVPNRGGLPTETYILLARKDQGIKELRDLKGKHLLMPSGGKGLISKMWIEVLLVKQGLPNKDRFFKDNKEVNKELHAVLPVFFKQADCCIVSLNEFNTMKELNPQLEKKLVVIAKSPAYLKSLFCFTKNFNEQKKNDILSVTFKLDTYARGKQILTLFRFDGIFPFKPDYLKNLAILISEYREVKTVKK